MLPLHFVPTRRLPLRARLVGAALGVLVVGLLAMAALKTDAIRARFTGSQATQPTGTEPLDIVLVADFSGANRLVGEDLARGFEDALKARGASAALRIVRRDDQGRPEAALALAEGAASSFQTLALIGPGHARGYAEFAAVAEQGEVPVLVPIAPPADSRAGKWVYTLQPSQPLQAELAGNLLTRIKAPKRVAFVTLKDAATGYWMGLARSFSESGAEAIDQRLVESGADGAALSGLANQLSPYDLILVDLPSAMGVTLVKDLRDAGHGGRIVAMGEMALPGFITGFAELPKERLARGFYTNGLFTITSFSPDETDEQGRKLVDSHHRRYGVDPSWAYAYGYDSGELLTTFMESRTGPDASAAPADPEAWRAALREFLETSRISSKPTQAFTGPMTFDENRQRDSQPSLMIYQNRRATPYPLQYSRQPARLESSQALEGEIAVGERRYDLVPVVFSGVRFHSISAIDFEKNEYTADFELWFRSAIGVEPEEVVFPSAIDGSLQSKMVESSETAEGQYRRIRFQGRFKFNATPKDLVLERIALPLAWRHRTREASQLRFVIDAASFNSVTINRPIHEQIMRDGVLTPSIGYVAVSSSIGVDSLPVRALGDPRARSGQMTFSEVATTVVVESRSSTLGPTLARSIPWNIALGASGALTALWLLMGRLRGAFRGSRATTTLVRTMLIACALLLGEVALFGSSMLSKLPPASIVWIRNAFSLGYYLAAAVFANLLISWLITWGRKGALVQGTLKMLTASLVYFCAFAAYYTNVLGRDFLPILATSSVLLTVIGLALRELILDAISGITIAIERSIRLGDWVHFRTRDSSVDGVVEELGWRAVRVRSRDDEIHFVPNSVVFQHVVTNRSLRGGYSRVDIPFEISSAVDLQRVIEAVTKAVAAELATDEGVDPSKPIRVICNEIDSDKAEAVAQVFYRADRSLDTLSTKVLQSVSAVLLKLDAMPVRQVALNRPKRG